MEVSRLFYAAIRNDNVEEIRKLLPDVRVTDKYSNTPLMYSAAVGSLESMKLLVEAGADVNARNAFDVTPLLMCAADEAKVRYLLSKGADANARSKQGRTALLIAAGTEGNSGVLRMLFAAGADLAKADASPIDTPVTAAAGANDNASFQLLMEHGAKVQGPAGGFALVTAAGNGNLEIMNRLLKAGVPADQPTPPVLVPPVKNGNIALGLLTPLISGASTAGPDAIKLLLEKGANVNRQDVRGMTPLMLSIGNDHPDIRVVNLLLEHGADVKLKSKAGETALDWARKFNHPQVLAALHLTAAPAEVVLNPKAIPARDAVQKSADLLQRTSATFFKEGGCASCHSHNLISMALQKAGQVGAWTGEPQAIAARREQTRLSWSAQQQTLPLRMDAPGGHDMVAYAVLQLAADEAPADATTDAMIHNIAAQQQLDGSWRRGGIVRPPMAESNVTYTALAIRCLAVYGPAGRKAEMTSRIARAAAWLRQADATTAEERNMQVLGLAWSGASQEVLQPLVKKVLALQRKDGGWAQTQYLPSDAYATGQTLAAFQEAGVTSNDLAYRRGVDFLLRTQRPDGSWHVASRSPKFQPYFQSGFPYDHDQWISMAATAWATMGLANASSSKADGRIMLMPIPYARVFSEAVFD